MTDDLHTEDDLGRDLRAMLAARAGDIRTVPDRLLTLGEPPMRDPRPEDPEGEVIDLGMRRQGALGVARRRWPVLVVAAAVLAILGGVLALLVGSPGHDRRVPPAHQPKLTTVVRASCRTTVPSAWSAIVSGASSRIPSMTGADVVAVTADGGAVVESTARSRSRYSSARLGYLAPAAASVHWVGAFGAHYAARGGVHSFVLAVDVTGHTALVTVQAGGRSPTTRQIVALDLESGRRTVLTRRSKRQQLGQEQAYGLNGVAYWQADRLVPGAAGGTVSSILSSPVSGGPVRVVASGDVYDLEKSALGIEWNLDDGPVDRPGDVPALVARHGASDSDAFGSFVNNGAVYAWQSKQGDLDWYDASTGRLIRVPHLLGVPGVAPGQAALFAVAGPIVYYQDQRGTADRVLDVRTGADMDLPVSAGLLGAGGQFIGSPEALNPSSTTQVNTRLLRLDAADLPAAACH